MEQNFNIQTSVLLSAIIISGSIIYASHSFGGTGSAIGVAGTNKNIPTTQVKITDRRDAPKEGNGKVVITEFSDFQCPFCKRFYDDAYKQIKAKYIDTGKVTFVYRHLPLAFHPYAQKAAEAGECANAQGRFWEYHDKLFSTGNADGSNLSMPNLKQYAKDLGLNTASFNSCLDNSEKADIVKADIAEAGKAGLSGTPSFVINGKTIVGAQPFSSFEQIIEAVLK